MSLAETDIPSIPARDDLVAYLQTQTDKLALKRKRWLMTDEAKNISVTLNNSGGAVVNIDSIIGQIHTNVRSIAMAGDSQFADAVTKLSEAIKTSEGLGEERGETLQTVEALSKEAAKSPAERSMGVTKSLYLGLASGVKVANDLATAWHTYGPVIAAHLGI